MKKSIEDKLKELSDCEISRWKFIRQHRKLNISVSRIGNYDGGFDEKENE